MRRAFQRAAHLGHELAVDHCAAVGEDGLHEAEDLAAEVDVWWGAGAGCYWGDGVTDVDAILAGCCQHHSLPL